MLVEIFSSENQQNAIQFLSKHEKTAVFLLGNLFEHGSKVGSHVNSGNFKLVRNGEGVGCVFCLTKRGNLLVQSEMGDEVFELILGECCNESFPIRGVIGEWSFAHGFWEYLKKKRVIQEETYASKEVNYFLPLLEWNHDASSDGRLLMPEDYFSWRKLRLEYLIEQHLPQDITETQMKQQFLAKCSGKSTWGVFQGSELVSIGELNAKTDSIATVGGVYTVPQMRRKGFGKALMLQLIWDCRNKLGLSKLIIFTGEQKNKPAQRLYESLGCQNAGHMALLFGK